MEINVIPDNYEPQQESVPFPSPFILSSVERAWCMENPAKIVFIKRRHLEENLKAMNIGMDEQERKRFLDYWCRPSRRDASEIKAERDEFYNLRQSAESWMERTPKDKPQKSRAEKYAESARQFFSNAQAVPPGADGTQGFGYADIPDEQ